MRVCVCAYMCVCVFLCVSVSMCVLWHTWAGQRDSLRYWSSGIGSIHLKLQEDWDSRLVLLRLALQWALGI